MSIEFPKTSKKDEIENQSKVQLKNINTDIDFKTAQKGNVISVIENIEDRNLAFRKKFNFDDLTTQNCLRNLGYQISNFLLK